MTGRRPRLLVLNQYYWPGVEATAHLLSELCAALADEFEIEVVTGQLTHGPDGAGVTEHAGVRIVRVRSTAYDRSRVSRRAFNYVSYLVKSLRAGLRAEHPDVVLCMTDPPIVANIGYVIARRFRVPLAVVSQDVFPEIAVELKRLENPFVIAALRWAIRFYLQRADCVVAIGETMRRRLIEKGAPAERIQVIANWVDSTAVRPQPRDNDWSREKGFTGRFVVMHSGNIGYAQNLDSLVRSATFLRDLDDVDIVLIGSGARLRELSRLSELLETDKVKFLPYQSRDVLSQSLSSADIHVIGLAGGLSGYVVPSRLYGVLSAGRPVIVTADADSETAQLVERVGCGIVIAPGRPELLAATIRRARDGEYDLAEMGRRGRAYIEQEADRTVAVARYRALLSELVARGRS